MLIRNIFAVRSKVSIFGKVLCRSIGLQDVLHDPNRQLMTCINDITNTAFHINEVYVEDSVLLLPKNFLIWNIKRYEDISIRSLIIFTFLFPTLDILIIGGGEQFPERLPMEITEYFRLRGTIVETMDTINACHTFNLLISEGRSVAAAILPLQRNPKHIKVDFDEL
jgi:NADH dehydrogenase [ubiquinone] 1 alpha subcomplex assembly factor 3